MLLYSFWIQRWQLQLKTIFALSSVSNAGTEQLKTRIRLKGQILRSALHLPYLPMARTFPDKEDDYI